MGDVFSAEKRSWIMSRVKARDTEPELIVRSMIHRMGFRFRINREDLPGKPDIVLPRHRKVIFIHGCFWHGHPGCSRSKRPLTNREFWDKKIDGNIERDKRAQRELLSMGWRVLTVWQCQTRDRDKLLSELEEFLYGE